MLTSESVRSELRALWEMLKVQGWRAVDTGTIVDLLVGQRAISRQSDTAKFLTDVKPDSAFVEIKL